MPEGPEGLPEGPEGFSEGPESLPEGPEGWPGAQGGPYGWTYGQTDVQNFSPFYRTLSPVEAAAQKERKEVAFDKRKNKEEEQ